MDIKKLAQEVFEIESKEIANLSKRLTDDFEKAINAILQSSGKLIVSGMGKSGIIGKKIAATLASTGTPSFYLHPGEAYHGDLGMIEENDIVLLISNSGETDEVLKLIPFLKHQKNCTISMSGSRTRSGAPASMGVSKIPGAMVHNRMPERERSRAIGNVIPTTPDLLAL